MIVAASSWLCNVQNKLALKYERPGFIDLESGFIIWLASKWFDFYTENKYCSPKNVLLLAAPSSLRWLDLDINGQSFKVRQSVKINQFQRIDAAFIPLYCQNLKSTESAALTRLPLDDFIIIKFNTVKNLNFMKTSIKIY